MDYEQIASQVEQASIGLQNNDTRKEAEQFLTNLSEHSDAIVICQIVLNKSNVELAQFQAATIIKNRIPIDFFTLDKDRILNIRNSLFEFCLSKPDLPTHTTSTIIQAVSTICKFSWVRDTDKDTSTFMSQVLSLYLKENYQKYLTLTLIKSLLDEFTVNSSTQVGLTQDMHMKVKMEFQRKYLLKVFLAVTNIMKEWLSNSTTSTESDPIAKVVCKLLETMVLWDFDEFDVDDEEDGSIRGGEGYDEDLDEPFASPGAFPDDWKPYITDPEFLSLLFTLHVRIQSCWEDRAPLDQVLITLSGLESYHFPSDQIRANYHQKFITKLTELMLSFENMCTQSESLFLFTAQMIHGIILSNKSGDLVNLEGSHPFLTQTGTLTLQALDRLPYQQDSTSIEEAFEFLLEAWSSLSRTLSDSDTYTMLPVHLEYSDNASTRFNRFVQEVSVAVVDKYFQTRLSIAAKELNEGGGGGDMLYKPWVVYDEQLSGIATLARTAPEPTLTLLHNMLNSNFSRLQQLLNEPENSNGLEVAVIFSNLRWLVLISGFVLADLSDSEVASVPASLNHYSSLQKDLSKDLVLTVPSLITTILNYFTTEPDDLKRNLCDWQLAEFSFWFIERWSHTYLFPSKDTYIALSANILNMFGTSSFEEAGKLILNHLVDAVGRNYLMWKDQPHVLKQVSRVLLLLCMRKESRLIFFNSEKFIQLAQALIASMDHKVGDANSITTQAVLIIATGTSNQLHRDALIGLITGRLQDQVSTVLNLIEQAGTNNPTNLNQIDGILEILHGFGLATDFSNCQLLFSCYSDYFEPLLQFAHILRTNRDIWTALFHFVGTTTKHMDLFDFELDDLKKLNTFIKLLFQSYVTNFNNIVRRGDVTDNYSDSLVEFNEALDALANLILLEKDLAEDDLEAKASMLEVIFFGAESLFPFIDKQMLQGVEFASSYYSVVALLLQQFPDKLNQLPPSCVQFMMESLTFALEHLIYDSAVLAYNTIFVLGLKTYNKGLEDIDNYLKKLVQDILNGFLNHKINWDLIEPASEALMVLILSQPDYFVELSSSFHTQSLPDQTAHQIRQQFINLVQTAQLGSKFPKQGRPTLDILQFRHALLDFLSLVPTFMANNPKLEN